MYELAAHWRRRLGVRLVDAAPSLAPGEGLDSDVWAANEFGGAPLGDKRLSARLVKSVGLLASFPGHAMTGNPSSSTAIRPLSTTPDVTLSKGRSSPCAPWKVHW